MKRLIIVAFILALGMIWIDSPTRPELTSKTGKHKMADLSNVMNDSIALQTKTLNDVIKSVSPGENIGFGLTADGAPQDGTSQPDPYAAWGGTAKYNSLINGYDTQKSNITNSAHDAAANSAQGLHGSILDFLDSLTQGQRKVDNQAVQNELSRNQGIHGILGMVGRGIRSGGVVLANKNASDSSAAQALANAYGQLGRQQMSNVGNQYALGQNAVDQSQQDLELQRAQGMRHINDSKVSTINNIVTDARQKLADLDAQIAGANLPNRIAIQQEQDRIRQDALGQLQQYDQELANGSAGIQGSSQDARRLQAAQLADAGTAPDSAFNFQTQAPAQFQGTGPFASDIPLFSTLNKNKQFA